MTSSKAFFSHLKKRGFCFEQTHLTNHHFFLKYCTIVLKF